MHLRPSNPNLLLHDIVWEGRGQIQILGYTPEWIMKLYQLGEEAITSKPVILLCGIAKKGTHATAGVCYQVCTNVNIERLTALAIGPLSVGSQTTV